MHFPVATLISRQFIMFVKNSTNCLCASLSLTFDRMGNNEIGLLLAGSSGFPSLGTGITSAFSML